MSSKSKISVEVGASCTARREFDTLDAAAAWLDQCNGLASVVRGGVEIEIGNCSSVAAQLRLRGELE